METDTREALEETLRDAAESIGRAVDLLQRRLMELEVERDDLEQKQKEKPIPVTPSECWDDGWNYIRGRQVYVGLDLIQTALSTLNEAIRDMAKVSAEDARHDDLIDRRHVRKA